MVDGHCIREFNYQSWVLTVSIYQKCGDITGADFITEWDGLFYLLMLLLRMGLLRSPGLQGLRLSMLAMLASSLGKS